MPLLFLIAILFIPIRHVAQQHYIPYLSDGKYGISDEAGNILITPAYSAIVTYDSLKIFAVQIDGKWGLINIKGKKVLPAIIIAESSPFERDFTAPYITHAIKERASDIHGKSVPKGHLYLVLDRLSSVVYYVNPFVPLNTYTPFEAPG